jgi:flagellar basal-body rod protein FlgC
MDPLKAASQTAGSGMYVQGRRLQVITENIANADSVANVPGGDPYRRKTISFGEIVDQKTGANMVSVDKVGRDMSKFDLEYNPSSPAADEQGYVKKANVNTLIEMADMREASRSFEASLGAYEAVKTMRSQTLDLLK